MNNYSNADKPTIETWDNVAKEYTLDFTENEKILANEIKEIFFSLGVKEQSSILELGCGSGHISGLLGRMGFDVALMDFSEVALNQSQLFFEKYNINGTFIKGDITEIDSNENIIKNYDVVWNSGVMEHFNDYELYSTFKAIRSKTKKFFVFIVPNPKSIPYLLFRFKLMSEGNWTYGMEYLRENYEELLLQAGFKLVSVHYLGQNYTKDHMDIVYGKNNSLYHDLINSNYLPEENSYLKAYVAVLDEFDPPLIDAANTVKVRETELITENFDLHARISGLELRNKIQSDSEINIKNQFELETNKLQQEQDKLRQEKEDLMTHIENYINKNKELKTKIEELERTLEKKEEHEHDLYKHIHEQNYQHSLTKTLLDHNEHTLNQIYGSHFWKLARIYYKVRDKTMLFKVLKSLKNEGFKKTLRKIKGKLKKTYINKKFKNIYEYELKQILKKHKGKEIIIFPPLLDWEIPLFQRPQHMAINLSNENYLYFYCTINHYDDIRGFKEYEENSNLYLTDQYELIMKNVSSSILHVYAQDSGITTEFINENIANGSIILYEYLDALHEDLCTSKNNVLERHINVLKNEECIVVATADKLFQEVSHYRENNFKLVTNGVDINHFRLVDNEDIPFEIKEVVEKKKPIIGYFGALAKWFDFELIEKVAQQRPNYEILLIGWDYDGTLGNFDFSKYENVTIIGPIDYKVLPRFAVHFNVSTIPFQLNEITEATSPIKLFEYMALGHPIVTTNLPECRKYQSVMIGEDHDSFITKLDIALSLENDASYKQLIDKEALENTWKSKAAHISELIKSKLNN